MADEKETAERDDASAPIDDQDAADEARQDANEASDDVETLRARITDLEKRLTKAGRSEKQITAATASLEKRAQAAEDRGAEAEKKLEQWNRWYFGPKGPASQEERANYARTQQTSSATRTATDASKAEAATWRAIAEEENPRVKKVLVRSAKDGEFLSSKQIKSLRDSLTDDDEDEESKTKSKTPPKVSGARTTGSESKSLDQRIAEAKKAGDKSEVLALLSHKAAAEQRIARG